MSDTGERDTLTDDTPAHTQTHTHTQQQKEHSQSSRHTPFDSNLKQATTGEEQRQQTDWQMDRQTDGQIA